MTYTESVIRDFLALDLELLEPGLELIDTEYRLPNPVGAKGFIDILAKDREGLIVVIELKRSDATARQCIHELFKYSGLLAMNHGVRLDQVRCIAVSTDWHELLLPFSELFNTGGLQLAGYKLTVDEYGRPQTAAQVKPLPAQSGMEMCPEHILFLYETHQARSDDLPRIQKNFSDLEIPDYVIVELNHVKNNPKVIQPFALLVALPLFSSFAQVDMHPAIQARYDEDCTYPLETAITIAIQEGLEYAALEISYPDKFVNMTVDRTWRIGRWYNAGKLQITPLRSTDVTLAEIAGLDSGLGTLFVKTLSPKNQIAWKRFRSNVALHTNWCEGWKADLSEFLDKQEKCDVTVSLFAYAPDDMMSVLHEAFIKGDGSYIPRLEVIVFDDAGIKSVLIGSIEWSGKAVGGLVDDFIHESFENFEGYIWHRHFGEQRGLEAAVCTFFELRYGTRTLSAEQCEALPLIDISKYRNLNEKALQDLEKAFASFPTTGG